MKKRIAVLMIAAFLVSNVIPCSANTETIGSNQSDVSVNAENNSNEVTKDNRLITYKAPKEVEISETYTVKARPVGSDDSAWQDLDVYRMQVMSNGARKGGVVYFDCTGPTEVEVTCTGKGDGIDDIENGLNSETAVYPESYNINLDYQTGGNVIKLIVEPGQRVVLDPNGDTRRNLQIWADEPMDIPTVEELEQQGKSVKVVDAQNGDKIDESYKGYDVVYVKPGYYANGDMWRRIFVQSNQTWYFEGGAVINGQLVLDNTENAKLIGHGIIYRPGHASMNVCGAKNAHIEGIMGLNHSWADNGGYFVNISDSKNIYLKNLKSIGRHRWGDSIDIFCSEDVTIEGCFLRGNDDCIAIYGPRWTGDHWGDTGNVRNIKVKNCVLMPDKARPIHFGTHGDSSSPNGGRVIDNCRFEDIDILTYNKYAFQYGSPMPQSIRMDVSEGNTVSNIYFDNIRIRDFAANKLVELYITTQDRYGTYTYPGKGINNIYFKDIDYKNTDQTFGGRIEGYKTSDGTDGITQNVTFENLKVNGEVAENAEDAHLSIGSNTRNIKFVKSGESKYVYNPAVVPEDIWPDYYDYARIEGASVKADSTAENSDDASAVLDEDDNTVWTSNVSSSDPQYNSETKELTGEGITVDLGAQRHINGVRVTWANPEMTHSYRIYVSKDGKDWSAGHTDEHGVGAVNEKAADEFNKRVKTTWFVNQHDPNSGQDYIIGQYVKIIPKSGYMLDMAKLEILGEENPYIDTQADNEELFDTNDAAVLSDDEAVSNDDDGELYEYAVLADEEFSAPEADNGAVNDVSNGGDWSIYASKIGYAKNTSDITDASSSGLVEVSSNSGNSEQLQFDLSTLRNNSAWNDDKVIKSAKLRLTPVVTRSGIKHNLYVIGNEFDTINGAVPLTQFDVPRGSNNDINKDGGVTSLASDAISEYPNALAKWQTDIDVTGNAVTAEDDKLTFNVEYASGNKEKTEYAGNNIAANGRLNTGAVPLLYNGGATNYSKWVYPQIVCTYTDSQVYKDAYADFISAYNSLNGTTVSDDNSITLDAAENGSDIKLKIYNNESSPIKADGNNLTIDNEYVGSDETSNVLLTVTKTEGEETAVYSRVVPIKAEYEKSGVITFDSAKNAQGEISITSAGKTYNDGTAYSKQGKKFYVNGGANVGYTANITVKNADTGDIIEANSDGSYTMLDGNAEVSAEYSKEAFGTSRIAASNSVSIKKDGGKQGVGTAQNLVIGAGRITFVKFDLSDYNSDIISEADISFNAWNTANTKAVFYVPNNDWDENTIDKNFKLDGTDSTSLSGFTCEDGSSVSLLSDDNIASLIVPNAEGEDNASNAANGILKDYYLGSTGTRKTASFDVTDAVKNALSKSNDKVITLMLYSTGGGNDASSVMYADSITNRPSLTITESASCLPDSELITEIKTAEDLEKFAKIVSGGNNYYGKTVTLENDIDLSGKYNAETGSSWSPIGKIYNNGGTINSFAGTFDGGNYSITGLYINGNEKTQGLFGSVSGTVKDLTVSGEIKASSVAGGIAAHCTGDIINCHSNVNITAEREAGGIAGTLGNGGIILNCDNAGNVTVLNKETYAGGIAGHNIMAVIEGCTNTGKIENGENGFRNRIGGITGFLDNGVVRGCHNEGDVISNAKVTSYTADKAQNYAGGIIGWGSYADVYSSTNSGNVSNAVDFAGGIAGCLQIGSLISDCTNSGNASGSSYVGGIVGYNINNIDKCHNSGVVTGEKYVGGVAGYLSRGTINSSTFENNDNLKDVGFNAFGEITNVDTPKPTEDSIAYTNGTAKIMVKSSGEYMVTFAAYNNTGALTGLNSQSVHLNADENTVIPSEFSTEGAALVKVMLWDSTSSMKPLCPSAVETLQ